MRTLGMLCIVGALMVAAPAYGASGAEKQTAIDAGLAWLATAPSGWNGTHWSAGGGEYDIAATSSALLAMAEEGHTPTSATAYSGQVASALSWLTSQAHEVGITGGTGVRWTPGHHEIYSTGLAIPAIVAMQDKTSSATIIGGNTYTYQQLVQMSVNYFAESQKKFNDGFWNGRGGWGYDYNPADARSDNSNAQWPVIGLLYAEGSWGVTPNLGISAATVKSEVDIWCQRIQRVDGGSDYDGHWNNSVMSRTGALVVEMIYAGYDTGTPAQRADLAAALAYLSNQWQQPTSGGDPWPGNFGHPYAMWGVYKGLELAIGLDDMTTIAPAGLHADPGDVDNPNHGWNWWEDYCEWLVSNQAGGTWPGHHYWGGAMATGWYVNILAATEIPAPIIPEPLTMIAVAGALVGLGGYVRKRRRA